jgi:hypothetical protein
MSLAVNAETSDTDTSVNVTFATNNMPRENLSLNVRLRILVTTPLQVARYIGM